MSNEPIISDRFGQLSGLRSAAAHSKPSSRGLLGELEQPSDVFRHLGPNWYTSIMGTGIVANAAALLPVHAAALHSFALGCVGARRHAALGAYARDRRALALARRERARASPRPGDGPDLRTNVV
jgi:hypothetical protein